MEVDRVATFHGLILVHLLLAITPLCIVLISFSTQTLPLIWALCSIPFAQIMLLAIWLGMAPGNLFSKLSLSIVSIFYVTIWPNLGWYYMADEPSLGQLLKQIFTQFVFGSGMLLVLAFLLKGFKRFLGAIRFVGKMDTPCTSTRVGYSLFSLLAVSTTASFVLGLARMARTRISTNDSPFEVASILLGVVVFFLILFSTIWATLGPGKIKLRLSMLFVVAILLGFAMSIAAGNSPFSETWWLFMGSSVIVFVPTAIVAVSLLYLRKLGYQLVSPYQPKSFRIRPSVRDESGKW